MRQKYVLITGGAGFVGHHLADYILKNTNWQIAILDRLSYASFGLNRLKEIKALNNKRVKIFTANFVNPINEGLQQELGMPDYIIHLGAETHVDNSIACPEPFVFNNVVGTMRILDYARAVRENLKWFVYFSTDEVFGPAPSQVRFKEWDCYHSRNPYAATKAAGEELCLAYSNTYQLPIIIIHCMNIFGERQHPEKFIPKVIRSILKQEKILIHADPSKTYSGSRFWIYAGNVAQAILFLLEQASISDKFNLVGAREINNLELAQIIAKIIGKPLLYELTDYHSSRPGHDLRYALDDTKMKKMGWSAPININESLRRVVEWTIKHPQWLLL